MPNSISSRLALVIVCSTALYSCADGQIPISPVSPSSTALQGSTGSPVSGRVQGSVYYDHEPGHPPQPPPDAGMPPTDPGMPPTDPGMPPTDPGMPPPEGVPVPTPPVPLTVNIVSAFGAGAFVPNPIQAVVGDTIVWMNNDVWPHTIILADGTIVGDLAPGQSSLPIALTSNTIGYQCTIHPSMVGQVVAAGTGEPLPPDQMPAPAPGPAQPDPYGDGYGDGYDDGYDDYGYLKSEL